MRIGAASCGQCHRSPGGACQVAPLFGLGAAAWLLGAATRHRSRAVR